MVRFPFDTFDCLKDLGESVAVTAKVYIYVAVYLLDELPVSLGRVSRCIQ